MVSDGAALCLKNWCTTYSFNSTIRIKCTGTVSIRQSISLQHPILPIEILVWNCLCCCCCTARMIYSNSELHAAFNDAIVQSYLIHDKTSYLNRINHLFTMATDKSSFHSKFATNSILFLFSKFSLSISCSSASLTIISFSNDEKKSTQFSTKLLYF